jgi:hypothetical protein
VGGWPAELNYGEDIEFSYLVRERFGGEIVFRESALSFHQDRESDEDLVRQAYGYGHGAAILYRRHPAELAWTIRHRLHRRRRSAQRWLAARVAGVGRRVGRVATEDAEFAAYLSLWDKNFWRGFGDGWRSTASPR